MTFDPPKGRILVVDDDPAICLVVAESLKRQGHAVKVAGSLKDRAVQLDAFRPDVLITDVMLPDGNGLDRLNDVVARYPQVRVIVLSAQNTLNTAVRAAETGAFEYLPKPFDLNELTRTVAEALRSLSSGVASAGGEDAPDDLPLVGRAPAMQDVYRAIARVMTNDLSILILGESGTGKELVARAIHDLGRRRSAPFVAINMGAIPRELIEAELFGYERGAFTGAVQRTAGKFEQAQAGTLFLDEIGDMPMDAQTRLLRVLQSGEVTTVGGTRPVRVDVRIIAATHKDLLGLIAEGRFREDLYYRLNVVPIHLPPLRERSEDVPLLARHFLDRAVADGLPRKNLSDDAAQLLALHSWPGNVRELQNLIQRLTVMVRDSLITADVIRPLLNLGDEAIRAVAVGETAIGDAVQRWVRDRLVVGGSSRALDLHDALLALVEPVLITETLLHCEGNQIRAASILGINRNTLRKKLTDYDIDPARLRPID